MFTISRLAKKFDLSRSTLLYYDRLGLLKPSRGGDGDYRYYSESDAQRLSQICHYRRAGLKLKEIIRVLESPDDRLTEALEKRLAELNEDVARLREQQRLIIKLLKNRAMEAEIGVMNRDTWVSLLAASGFDEDDMIRWHIEFERHSPEKHQEFLEFLCIPEEEISLIRQYGGAESELR